MNRSHKRVDTTHMLLVEIVDKLLKHVVSGLVRLPQFLHHLQREMGWREGREGEEEREGKGGEGGRRERGM